VKLARLQFAFAAALLLAGCGSAATTPSAGTGTSSHAPGSTTAPSSTVTAASSNTRPKPSTATGQAVSTTPTAATRTTVHSPPAQQTPPASVRLLLAGRTVGIDPGHNGENFTDPAYINHLIWDGREMKACNTTGTATDSGYTEAQFNFNVASDLATDLLAQGARVVMTRHTNTGVGPCTNVRAAILNRSGAAVAINIHADGGPPSGRGVAVLEPVPDGPNDHVIEASERFGRDVLDQYEALTGMPASTYDGTGGIVHRDDLTGLNLTTVPEVLIESGNMRNATDAALLTSPSFQRLEARALDGAILQFLTGQP